MGLVPCFPVNIPGKFQFQCSPCPRNLHLYWNLSNMVPFPVKLAWPRSLFRGPEVELLAPQCLHLLHQNPEVSMYTCGKIQRYWEARGHTGASSWNRMSIECKDSWTGLNTDPKRPDGGANPLLLLGPGTQGTDQRHRQQRPARERDNQPAKAPSPVTMRVQEFPPKSRCSLVDR